jgi:CHASE3 domain sensor protein
MEKEIAALKARLATSDERVKELEASKVSDPQIQRSLRSLNDPQIQRSFRSVSDPQIQRSLRSVSDTPL